MHSSCDLKQLQCNHLKSDWLNYKTGTGKKIFTLQSRINVAQMVFSENLLSATHFIGEMTVVNRSSIFSYITNISNVVRFMITPQGTHY